jgi:stalled ribosome alternative rescue factor ArfA
MAAQKQLRKIRTYPRKASVTRAQVRAAVKAVVTARLEREKAEKAAKRKGNA